MGTNNKLNSNSRRDEILFLNLSTSRDNQKFRFNRTFTEIDTITMYLFSSTSTQQKNKETVAPSSFMNETFFRGEPRVALARHLSELNK